MLYGDGDYETLRKRAKKRLSQRNELYGHIIAFVIIMTVIWGVWANGFTFGWQTPWPLIIGLVWITGLTSHIIDVFLKSDGRPAVVNREVAERLYYIFGSDWENLADEKTYKKVRKSVRSHIDSRAEFYQHILSFPPMMLLFHILQTTGLTFGLAWSWVPIIGVLWLLGLIIHGMNTLLTTSENRIQREVEREIERTASQPRKRQAKHAAQTAAIRLGDDGELHNIPDDDAYSTREKARKAL